MAYSRHGLICHILEAKYKRPFNFMFFSPLKCMLEFNMVCYVKINVPVKVKFIYIVIFVVTV